MPNSCPDPGVYPDIPFEDYLAWDAISNSRLGLVSKSPLHFRSGFASESSDALRLGSLVHCGVLEPDKLRERYAVMPAFHKDPQNHTVKKVKGSEVRSRSYSAATSWVAERQAEWRAANEGKEEVSQEFFDQFCGIATQICENPLAMELFDSGQAEVSIVWDDLATGMRCKARIDWFDPANGRFVDLKTARDVLDFEWSVRKYGYGRQMAFYQDGLRHLFDSEMQPYIICAETSRPYACRAAPCSRGILRDGLVEACRLLWLLRECAESNDWPGPENPEQWGEPEAPKLSSGVSIELADNLMELEVAH